MNRKKNLTGQRNQALCHHKIVCPGHYRSRQGRLFFCSRSSRTSGVPGRHLDRSVGSSLDIHTGIWGQDPNKQEAPLETVKHANRSVSTSFILQVHIYQFYSPGLHLHNQFYFKDIYLDYQFFSTGLHLQSQFNFTDIYLHVLVHIYMYQFYFTGVYLHLHLIFYWCTNTVKHAYDEVPGTGGFASI